MSWQDELLALVEKNEEITPAEVLAYAKKHPKSELHSQFVWDDATAGARYRLDQARYLLRRVKVTITSVNDSDKQIRVRAFSHVPSAGAGVYRPTANVLKHNADELLQQALADLNALRRKYESLLTWSKVLEAHQAQLERVA